MAGVGAGLLGRAKKSSSSTASSVTDWELAVLATVKEMASAARNINAPWQAVIGSFATRRIQDQLTMARPNRRVDLARYDQAAVSRSRPCSVGVRRNAKHKVVIKCAQQKRFDRWVTAGEE